MSADLILRTARNAVLVSFAMNGLAMASWVSRLPDATEIAVRADRMRLGPEAGAEAVPAKVVSIEYQGTSVHVGFEADGLGGSAPAALTAVIADGAYASRPLALGQTVPLGWDEAAAHRLNA